MNKKYKFPFFVAEISSNHNGSISKAKKLIKCAKDNGADAVKLQTFEPKSMTVNVNSKKFIIQKGLWKMFHFGIYIRKHKLHIVGKKHFFNTLKV